MGGENAVNWGWKCNEYRRKCGECWQWVRMPGIRVGMQRIGVGMQEIRVGMREIEVGMRGIGVGNARNRTEIEKTK